MGATCSRGGDDGGPCSAGSSKNEHHELVRRSSLRTNRVSSTGPHIVLVGLDGAGKSALVFALQHPTVTVGKTTYRNPLESAHHYTSAHPHGGGSSDHFSGAVCDERYREDVSTWSTDPAVSLGNLAPPPTSAVQHVRMCVNGAQVTVVDMPGRSTARAHWPAQLLHCSAVVMVLDSSDHGRLQVARQELQSLCPTLRSRRLPVLLLANKQDVLDAMSIAAVGAAMADVLGALRRRDGGGEAEEGCATWVAGCSAGDTASVQAALEWVLARAQRS